MYLGLPDLSLRARNPLGAGAPAIPEGAVTLRDDATIVVDRADNTVVTAAGAPRP